jgi:peptidoglycan/LPS O-acetylase OafA/YrhL
MTKVISRQANIELLRLIAMLSILSAHFGARIFPDQICKFDLSMVTGVPAFIMITGYFMIDKPLKSSRLLKIVAQTSFYCILLTLVAGLLGTTITGMDILKSIIPFGATKFNYWFIERYVGLISLLPFLSILSRHLTQRKHLFLLVILWILMGSVVEGWPLSSCFSDGWKLQWFIFLFFLGGYMRKFMTTPHVDYKLTVLFIVYLILLKFKFFHINIDMSYNGLSTTIGTIIVLQFFRSIHISPDSKISRIINWLATGCFAVYLIHTHHYFSEYLYSWGRALIQPGDGFVHYFQLAAYSLGCFLILLLVDKIRLFLFDNCGINKFIEKVSVKADTLIHTWINQ